MKIMILAGGSGTRLWPVSRQSYPKQFLRIQNENSLLQNTILRFKKEHDFSNIYIISNKNYQFLIKEQLKEINFPFLDENMILEPSSRNTASAIALLIKYLMDIKKCSKDEVIMICPSDHIFNNSDDSFTRTIREAQTLAAKGNIITFGIKPDHPDVDYGYIKLSEKFGSAYKVESFVEKPAMEKAKEYLDSGKYLWNSGMFVFSIGSIVEEFKNYLPEVYDAIEKDYDTFIEEFDTLPDISIDYAIMEKTHNLLVLEYLGKWSDLGSWDNVYNILDKDENNNVVKGASENINLKNSLIWSNKRVISTIGLEDMLVIDTPDAILISKRKESENVKDILESIKSESEREINEHLTTYRPWGHYTIIEDTDSYKVKKIVVEPKAKLSLQLHHHRSEHWTIVSGTALVTIDDEEKYLHKNESIYISKTHKHRLENPGQIPLEVIEVQIGEYLEEDDIVRFDDIYKRD